MTKSDFLAALEQRLKGRLPDADVLNTLDFYSESIDDHMEDGMTEEEAVAAVGTPESIAAQILADLPEQKPFAAPQPAPVPSGSADASSSALRGVGSVLLMLLAIWALVVYYSVTFGLLMGAVGCIIGGTVCLTVVNLWVAMIVYGAGLICLGLGLLFCPGLKKVTRGLGKLIAAPFRMNKKEGNV